MSTLRCACRRHLDDHERRDEAVASRRRRRTRAWHRGPSIHGGARCSRTRDSQRARIFRGAELPAAMRRPSPVRAPCAVRPVARGRWRRIAELCFEGSSRRRRSRARELLGADIASRRRRAASRWPSAHLLDRFHARPPTSLWATTPSSTSSSGRGRRAVRSRHSPVADHARQASTPHGHAARDGHGRRRPGPIGPGPDRAGVCRTVGDTVTDFTALGDTATSPPSASAAAAARSWSMRDAAPRLDRLETRAHAARPTLALDARSAGDRSAGRRTKAGPSGVRPARPDVATLDRDGSARHRAARVARRAGGRRCGPRAGRIGAGAAARATRGPRATWRAAATTPGRGATCCCRRSTRSRTGSAGSASRR